MIDIIVILGPNLPVKALPNLDLVDIWTIGMLISRADLIVFCTSSSTPFLSGFLSMFNATISNLDLFLSIIVYRVLLHYFIPETINFFGLVGFVTFLIACL